MDNILWLFFPVFVAVGSALLAFYLMQSKLEVAVSKERETLAEARAIINAQHKTMEERVRATQEETKRKALDDFLSDFRVEERHYLRESKSLFMNRKSMILQERLYFRNIPLSNWVEHEMVVEDGNDIQRLAKACSVFSTRSMDNASQQMGRDLPAAAAAVGQSLGQAQAGSFQLPKSSSRMLERT
jgi:ATP-dependent DNA ligase